MAEIKEQYWTCNNCKYEYNTGENCGRCGWSKKMSDYAKEGGTK